MQDLLELIGIFMLISPFIFYKFFRKWKADKTKTNLTGVVLSSIGILLLTIVIGFVIYILFIFDDPWCPSC